MMRDGTPLLRFLGHSTVLLELDGQRVLTDPLLEARLGLLHRHAGHGLPGLEGKPIDVVLISHAHHDHLHLPSLRRLPARTRIVAPAGLGALIRRTGHEVVEVRAGDEVAVGRLRLVALHAEHDGGRRPFGPTCRALGFRIDGSVGVYFAGDTDLFDGMRALEGSVDLALLPVWGWGPSLGGGHLDPRRAAEAVARIRPRVAIPIHWGTFYPVGLARLWPRPLGNPPKVFAREVARLAPLTEVRILAPGEVTAIELAS